MPRIAFSQEVAEQLVADARKGLHKQVCAWGAGIHLNTLCRWLNDGDEGIEPYSEFARDFRAAEAEAVRKLHDRLTDLANGEEGNHHPAVELLKRRWPKLYGDRAALEHSGPDGGAMRHEVSPADIQSAVATRFGSKVAVEQKDDSGDPPDES